MPKKTIHTIQMKELENEFISDSMDYTVQLINTLKPSIYRNMTKSNLNNILQGATETPPYIEYITSEPYNEYIRPYFLEFYPNKEYITNKGTLQKYYKIVVDYLIEQQTNEI